MESTGRAVTSRLLLWAALAITGLAASSCAQPPGTAATPISGTFKPSSTQAANPSAPETSTIASQEISPYDIQKSVSDVLDANDQLLEKLTVESPAELAVRWERLNTVYKEALKPGLSGWGFSLVGGESTRMAYADFAEAGLQVVNSMSGFITAVAWCLKAGSKSARQACMRDAYPAERWLGPQENLLEAIDALLRAAGIRP